MLAVATHTHLDHIGGHHEFEETVVHATEAGIISEPESVISLRNEAYFNAVDRGKLADAGYEIPDGCMITAIPEAGYDPDRFRLRPAKKVRPVEEGMRVDTGDRSFEVLHLPGHSPGSIGLWESKTGTLFSGDALYDGPLLDQFGDSDVPAYIRTMERLRDLRLYFQHITEGQFCEVIERALGRRVRAFVSGMDTRKDVAAELFYLESEDEPPEVIEV